MNNLTSTEYFKDRFETSSQNKYFKVIRAVRLDSPGSYFSKKGVSGEKFTKIIIYALVRTDKDSFRSGTYIIDNFEEDNETIKRDDPPVPGKIGKYLRIDTDRANSEDNNFSKKELDAFELDSNKQLEYINIRIKRDFTTEGPWSIIQDPWDPTVFVDFIPGPPEEPIKPDENISKTTPAVETTPEPVVATPVVLPPIKLQCDFNFSVKKENTFVITSGNNGNIVSLPDGTIVDLGELSVVKKEDPTNPEIIRLLTPYSDQIVELDSEYTDENFAGTEEELIFLDGTIDTEFLNAVKGYNPENPDENRISADNSYSFPISKDVEKNIKLIIKDAKDAGITNGYTIAAMLAVCKKECGLVPKNEDTYGGTEASRIKGIFSSMQKYTDAEVNKIKKDFKKFFNIIYGGQYKNAADEGYKYRGRGLNQLTFKGNYILLKDRTGIDIVSDPESVNKIEVATKVLVEYMKYKFEKEVTSFAKKTYNFTDINSFKNIDDAVGAVYHANAGFGTTYKKILKDATGGRALAFKYVSKFYEDYLGKNRKK
jgi:predicted chitinase